MALTIRRENGIDHEQVARRRLVLADAARHLDLQGASNGNSQTVPSVRICVRAASATADLRTLRLFYEIGKEWDAGAPSLRGIARKFVERDLCGTHAVGLAATLSSVQRACKEVRRMVAKQTQGRNDLCLFTTYGIGHSFTGLTPFGRAVWLSVREYLLLVGVLEESS